MDQYQKALKNAANKTVLEKPSASLLQDSVNFWIEQKLGVMDEKKLLGGCSRASNYVNTINGVKNALKANEMLKELHPWADQSLTEDFLEGVNYDVDKISSSFKMMFSSEQKYDDSRVTGTEESKINCKESSVIENDSVNFPIKQKLSVTDEKRSQGGSSSSFDYVNTINGGKNALKANEMLKKLHPWADQIYDDWADQSLSKDVLDGVNYYVDEASSTVSSEQKYDDWAD